MLPGRKYLRPATLAGGIAAAVMAVYVLSRTSVPVVLTQYVGNHVALSVAVAALVLLVSFAIGSLVYGFGLEGRLGRSGKMHDLGRR